MFSLNINKGILRINRWKNYFKPKLSSQRLAIFLPFRAFCLVHGITAWREISLIAFDVR